MGRTKRTSIFKTPGFSVGVFYRLCVVDSLSSSAFPFSFFVLFCFARALFPFNFAVFSPNREQSHWKWNNKNVQFRSALETCKLHRSCLYVTPHVFSPSVPPWLGTVDSGGEAGGREGVGWGDRLDMREGEEVEGAVGGRRV